MDLAATDEEVTASMGKKVVQVSVTAVEVENHRVIPRIVATVHVHSSFGDQVLLDATLETIATLRSVADVIGATRIAPDRKYQRMQILLGGISV